MGVAPLIGYEKRREIIERYQVNAKLPAPEGSGAHVLRDMAARRGEGIRRGRHG